MKTKPVLLLGLTLAALPALLSRSLERMGQDLALILCCAAIVVAAGLAMYALREDHTRTVVRFPVLGFRHAGLVLGFLLTGMVAATAYKTVQYLQPRSDLKLIVDDENGSPLSDILVSLWDPAKPSMVGDGQVTDSTGEADFLRVPYGRKKIYLIRQEPDSTWRFMEVSVSVIQQLIEFRWRFKPNKVNPFRLEEIRFEPGDYDVRTGELIKLEGIKPALAAANGRIFVLANTDEAGSEDFNTQLGASRARSLVDLMRGFGFPVNRIRAFTFGKRWQKPPSSPTASVQKTREENRRDEIFVIGPSTDGSEDFGNHQRD